MPRKISRRLVIDASVVCSAGGEGATFPTSKYCRDCLITILEVCHRVVVTADINNEWRIHQSGFARRWRVSMVARKKLHVIELISDNKLRARIEATSTKEKALQAMRKDLHLIEAAIATDQTILSLDETVRGLFAIAARKVGELRTVVWVNPDNTGEEVIKWLEGGAKPERERQLSSYL